MNEDWKHSQAIFFWRYSGFLSHRNVMITMLELSLDSSGVQCWTVVMKKDAYKCASVRTLWYMGTFFFTVFSYFFFCYYKYQYFYWFMTQNIKVYSLFHLLTSFNNSTFFFQTKATLMECMTVQCEISLSWQKMHQFEVLTQHCLGDSE